MQRYGNDVVRIGAFSYNTAIAVLTYSKHWRLFAKSHPKWLQDLTLAERSLVMDKILPGIVCGMTQVVADNQQTTLQVRQFQTLAAERFMQASASVDFEYGLVYAAIRKAHFQLMQTVLSPTVLDQVVQMVQTRFGKYEDQTMMRLQGVAFRDFWMELVTPAVEAPITNRIRDHIPPNMFTTPPDPIAFRRQQQALISALSTTRRIAPDKLMQRLGLRYA
jgi:hypothetical protein